MAPSRRRIGQRIHNPGQKRQKENNQTAAPGREARFPWPLRAFSGTRWGLARCVRGNSGTARHEAADLLSQLPHGMDTQQQRIIRGKARDDPDGADAAAEETAGLLFSAGFVPEALQCGRLRL